MLYLPHFAQQCTTQSRKTPARPLQSHFPNFCQILGALLRYQGRVSANTCRLSSLVISRNLPLRNGCFLLNGDVSSDFLGKLRDQEIKYHPDPPTCFQFAMSDEPNFDHERVKLWQRALHRWLGVSDILCHKPDAQSLLDKLPLDEVVLRYDRKVSQCQRKSTLIERFDNQASSVNA